MTRNDAIDTPFAPEAASRCPDFDNDCAGVINHLGCWKGFESEQAGVIYFTGPADGYCPYVIGMIPTGSRGLL